MDTADRQGLKRSSNVRGGRCTLPERAGRADMSTRPSSRRWTVIFSVMLFACLVARTGLGEPLDDVSAPENARPFGVWFQLGGPLIYAVGGGIRWQPTGDLSLDLGVHVGGRPYGFTEGQDMRFWGSFLRARWSFLGAWSPHAELGVGARYVRASYWDWEFLNSAPSARFHRPARSADSEYSDWTGEAFAGAGVAYRGADSWRIALSAGVATSFASPVSYDEANTGCGSGSDARVPCMESEPRLLFARATRTSSYMALDLVWMW